MPTHPGLIEQPFDPLDVWEDEVLGGEEVKLPKEYRISGLKYEYQGLYPYCVPFTVTTMIEWLYKQEGDSNAFSQPHLFHHSGGSYYGSTFRGNLNTARREDEGVIPYKAMPMPSLELYKTGTWLKVLNDKAQKIPFKDASQIGGYVKIEGWDLRKLKEAIYKYGPILIGVYASAKDGYYIDPWHTRKTDKDNHAVLAVGWTDDGRLITFDSLGYVREGRRWSGLPLEAGYRTMSDQYTIRSAYAVTGLPDNWRELRDEARKAPSNNENRYGKQRNYEKEVEVANQMLKEFKKFNNQSVLEAAGRFWEMYIRAVAYGGYNISYRKWGMWQPGDVINDCYHWRRTGEHIFDFNKLRSEHK